MQIFVTPRAEKNFDTIVAYIKENFGENTTKLFIKKVDEIFTLLSNYPQMGQTEYNDIRGFQLSPQTKLLYRIRNNKIIILTFFDVRQNPKKKYK